VFTWSAWVRRTLSARGLMSSMEDMAGEVYGGLGGFHGRSYELGCIKCLGATF
jgi:hypothetical protein